jgi:hypothetical protein
VEDEVHAAFEWFCLSHLGRTEDIPTLFEHIGVPPLSDDQARPVLAPHQGSAWLMDGEHSRFIVALTEQGACSLFAPYADRAKSTELFKTHIRHRKLVTERVGSQTQDVFAVTFPDAIGGSDEHALVMLTTSNLDTIQGVMLNALPEELAVEAGISIPEWP